MIDSILLHVSEEKPGEFLPYVDILVDGQKMHFLLDTGAATSSIEANGFTSQYASQGKTDSTGASGKPAPCDFIQPDKVVFGNQLFTKPRLKSCETNAHKNILGLDLLEGIVFEIDFSEKRMNILANLPIGQKQFSIKRLAPGHVTVPATLSGQNIDVLFDTGANATVIDSQFIENHSSLFTLVRSEDGFDGHGNKIPSKVYHAKSLKIGRLDLKNVEMASFEFGDHLRGKMEGVPIILGNNVITKGKWAFDLTHNSWAMEAY